MEYLISHVVTSTDQDFRHAELAAISRHFAGITFDSGSYYTLKCPGCVLSVIPERIVRNGRYFPDALSESTVCVVFSIHDVRCIIIIEQHK